MGKLQCLKMYMAGHGLLPSPDICIYMKQTTKAWSVYLGAQCIRLFSIRTYQMSIALTSLDPCWYIQIQLSTYTVMLLCSSHTQNTMIDVQTRLNLRYRVEDRSKQLKISALTKLHVCAVFFSIFEHAKYKGCAVWSRSAQKNICITGAAVSRETVL